MKAKETYQSIKADMSSRIEQKLKELQALTADDIIDTYKEDIKALSVLDGKYPGTGGIRTFVTGRDRNTYDFIDLDQYYIKDEVDELIAKEESGRHDDDDKLSKEIEDLAEALEQETAERIEEDQKEHDRSVEADEKIGEAIETLREDLTTETEERKQADSEEAATREAADNQLQSNIDAEAATREAADKTLQDNIDIEEAERKAADQVLLENIDTEAATREDADNILQENIDKEAATREAADNTLQSNIDAEAATRENADNQLLANIDAEQKARENADDNLQSEIDTEIATRENADNELWEALKEEAATREDNDNTLQSNIDAEAKTREENDNTLQANIDKEQSEREAADDTLQQNINTEQAAREEADDTLQANLDQEAAERQEADDILLENIDTEAFERESADQVLQENLDNETAEREAADQVLQDNIDTKQNILTAGRGIDITDDVISCTFDHNVFIYCGTSLPEHPDEEDRYKIFLISNPNQTSEDNVLIEYIWIGESYLIGSWEKIGEFNAGIDLDLYYTKEEVDKITDNLQTQIDTNADNILTNADNIEQNASKIETNANNIEANAEAIAALDESKQDKLTAGNGITINEINGETVIAWTEEQRLVNVETGVEDNKTAIAGLDESKQDKLTAGNGISITKINDETIIAWTEEERLIAVETGIDDNSTAITDLDGRVSTNESNIAANTSDISALESKEQADVDALNALVSDLTGVEHTDFENVQNLIANLQVDVNTNATNIEVNKDAISDLQNTKQDVLQAGDNITILDNVISAVDTTYTAGDHINISNTNVISADLDDYVTETELAGLQSQISANASDISVLLSNVSTNTSDITNLKSLVTSNISDISTLQAQVSEHTDAIILIESDLSGKQDNLVAGDNIKISGDVISAVDTTYTAGDNILISNTNTISADLSKYATSDDLSNLESKLEGEINSYGGITDVKVNSTDPLSLTANQANGLVTITGTVDAYSKSDVDSKISDINSQLSNINGAVTSVSASGTSPLSLSGSISNNKLTLSGSVSTATTSALGVVKPKTSVNSSQSVNTASTTSGRYYGIGIDGNGELYVNVPWEDTGATMTQGITKIETSYKAPLSLDVSTSGTTATIIGTVDTYSKSDIDNIVSLLEASIGDASSSGVTSVTASGDSLLTLSASPTSGAVKITGSVNLSDYYTKDEVDTKIGESSSGVSSVKVSSGTLTVSPTSASSGAVEISVEADNYYTKSEVDNKISGITTTIGTATATELGAVMVGSVLSSTIDVQEETTRSDRYYYVDICNSGSDSGKLVVNIPWEAGEAGGGITDLSVSGTSPLTLIGTVNGSIATITGSVDLSDYATKSDLDSKQDKLIEGSGIIIENNVISSYNGGDVDLSDYQKKLDIVNNVSVTFPEGDVEDSITLELELNDNILSLNGVFNLGSLATQNYVDEAVRNGGGTTLNYYSENTSSKTAYLGYDKASSIVINPTDQILFNVENANWGSVSGNGGEPQANLGTTIFNERPEVTIINNSNRKGDNNIVVFNDLNDYQEKLTAGTGITISGNIISATGSTIGTATDEQLGLVKIGTAIVNDVSVNPETYEDGKFYYVDMIGNGSDAGKLVVNVPWYASEGGGGGGTSLEKVVCTTTSPLNLSGSVTDSGATLNLSGNIGTAGEDNYGIVRVGSVIAAGVEINNSTTTAGRYYYVDIMHPGDSDNAGRLVVNVPWESGSEPGITSVIGSALAPLTLGGLISGGQLTISGSIATASADNLGVVMPYYDSNGSVLANSQTTTSGRTYGIAGQSDGKLIVNVPWTDTTYTAGSGISISSSNVISSTSSYHHYEEVYSGNNDSTDYGRMYTHYNSIYGVFESVASSDLASGNVSYFTTDYPGTAGSLPEIYSRDDNPDTRPRAVLAVHPDFIKFTIDQLSGSEYSNELVFDRNALYVGGTQVPVPQISANQTNPSADIYFYNSQLITGTIDSNTTYNFHQTGGKKGAQVQIILQATKDVTVTLSGTYAKVTDGYTNFTVSSNKYVEINAVYDGNYIYVRSSYMES